jgi:Protein of unknown function (DUF3180)
MSSGPGMRSTTWGDLAVPFFVVGVTVFVLLRFSYDSIPPLHYFAAVPLGALAAAELVAARRVRAAVRHDPHARPMAALVIARCVALGKASSLVGAGVAGAVVGLLARVLPDVRVIKAAASDTAVGAVLLAVAAALVAAGLLLERAGIDPNRDHDSRDRRP